MSRRRTCLGPVRRIVQRDSPSLLAVAQLGVVALGLCSAPIVARAIGPSGRGETAAALALFYIVPAILALGMPLELRRLGAMADPGPMLRTSRLICLALLAPAAVLSVAAYATIFSSFDSATRWTATFGVAIAPASVSWLFDLSVLIVRSHYLGVLLLKLTQPLVYLVGVAVLWSADAANTATILAVSIAGSVASAAVGASLTKVSLRGRRGSARELSVGGRRFAGGAVADITSNKLDQVLALPLLGSHEAGLYAVASTVASLPLVLGHALGGSYFVAAAAASDEDRRALTAEAARGALSIGLLASVLVGCIAWPTVPIVFGEDFREAVPVVWIYLVGSIALVANFVCTQMLAATGRGRVLSAAQVGILPVSIGTLLVLGPLWGSLGAAAASSLGYWGLFCLLALALRIRPGSLLIRPSDFGNGLRYLVRTR